MKYLYAALSILALCSSFAMGQIDSTQVIQQDTIAMTPPTPKPCRPHWGIGLRPYSLISLPGKYFIEWYPTSKLIIGTDLAVSFYHEPYQGRYENNVSVSVAPIARYRVSGNNILKVYGGLSPSYQLGLRSRVDQTMKHDDILQAASLGLLSSIGADHTFAIKKVQINIELLVTPLRFGVYGSRSDEYWYINNKQVQHERSENIHFSSRLQLADEVQLSIKYLF